MEMRQMNSSSGKTTRHRGHMTWSRFLEKEGVGKTQSRGGGINLWKEREMNGVREKGRGF